MPSMGTLTPSMRTNTKEDCRGSVGVGGEGRDDMSVTWLLVTRNSAVLVILWHSSVGRARERTGCPQYHPAFGHREPDITCDIMA